MLGGINLGQPQQEKDWTILIYANGNNELQPEMWQAKLAAEQVGSNEQVNVILQISREKNEVVNILRPCAGLPKSNVRWTGARRYFLTDGTSILIKNLGKINMADPMQLYEFIQWAFLCYPAKHYLLILSGHGYQFVGAMTDYSQNAPYIMGIPEMSQAFNFASKQSGPKIDLLVLDICYFNFIEVLYELGKDENHAIQNVLTYIDTGPIQGLPYDKLLQAVRQNCHITDLHYFIKEIINSLQFDLVAFEINHDKLKYIKKLYNDLADCYLAANDTIAISLHELYSLNPTFPWYTLSMSLQYNLLSLIIHAKNISNSSNELLHVANLPTDNPEYIALYSRLSFAQNNHWAYLLSNKTSSLSPAPLQDTVLTPLQLALKDVYTYISIMNPTSSDQQKQDIFTKLLQYKNWL